MSSGHRLAGIRAKFGSIPTHSGLRAAVRSSNLSAKFSGAGAVAGLLAGVVEVELLLAGIVADIVVMGAERLLGMGLG